MCQKSKRTTADKNWRRKVLERDNYTCLSCGTRDLEILTAHHVMQKQIYPHLRHDVANGMTLCRDCHDFEERDSYFRSEFIKKTLIDNRYNKALLRNLTDFWKEIPTDNRDPLHSVNMALMYFIEDMLKSVGYLYEINEETGYLTITGRDGLDPEEHV